MVIRAPHGMRFWRVVTLGAAAAALPCSVSAAAPLAAGAGRATVELTPAMLPLDGFTVVHDPLSARVVVLAEGKDRAAIAVIDQTSMGGDVVDAAKAIVSRDTATPAGAILVVASHSFSVPHMFTADHLPPGLTMASDEAARAKAYHDAVLSAVDQAAKQAVANADEAHVAWGSGKSDVNVNRNVPAADGWWLGANSEGFSDKDLAVVRIDGRDGQPLAVLADYGVQSAVMDHSVGASGKGVSSDLGGAAVRHLEKQYGGSVALFLTGAAGDQLPGYTARQVRYDKDGAYRNFDLGDDGYTLLNVQGGRLGEDAVRAVQSAAPIAAVSPLRVISGDVALDAQQRPTDLRQIKPSRHYDFQPAGPVDAPFVVLQLGDLAIVGVQAELSAVTGQMIRQRSPFAHTMVVTMVNGAAKYMPEAESYDRITYEAMNSSFARGSAERFADAIVSKLQALHAAAR